MPTQADIRQSVLRSALNMAGTAINATVDGILTAFDPLIGKLFEDRNIVLTGGGLVTFTGTQLQFTEALNITLNQKISGAVPQVISLGSSTQTFTNSGDMWVAVLNRTAGTATSSIISSGSALPAVSSSNEEVFIIAKRVDATDTTTHIYFRSGWALTGGQTARLGGAPTTSSSLAIKNNGTTVDSATISVNFTGNGAASVDASAGNVNLPLPDGFFDPSEMITKVEAVKNGSAAISKIANQIIDVFSQSNTSPLGTLSNLTQVGGILRPSAGQTSGTYTRTRNAFANSNQIQGVIKHRSQQLAPAATSMSPSSTSTSVTISFTGDVTPFINTGTTLAIAQLESSDSEIQLIPVKDTSGPTERVAVFSVTSSTFSTGTTSVVVSNPNGYDLSLGISAGSFPTSLRVIPFDVSVQVKSSGSYQSISPIDFYALNTVGINPSTSLNQLVGSIQGSVLSNTANISPKGQYIVVKVLEDSASNAPTIHWFASTDYGYSFAEIGTKTGDTTIVKDDYDSGTNAYYAYNNPSHIVVADNGKMFSSYTVTNGTATSVKGVYCDLTAGIPTLNDVPINGTLTTQSNNAQSGQPGTIFNAESSSNPVGAQISADLADLSYIVVLSKVFVASNAGTQWSAAIYTNGGATWSTTYSSAATNIQSIACPDALVVTGTSGSHKVVGTFTDQANSNHLSTMSWLEGAASATLSSNTFSATSYWIMDSTNYNAANGGGNYNLINLNNTSLGFYTVSTSGASPSFSAMNSLTGFAPDAFNGSGSASINSLFSVQYWKTLGQRIVVDPNNSNHVFFATDMVHPDSVRRATLFEVPNSSSYVGPQQSNFLTTTTANLRDTTTNTIQAQTFTTTGAYALNTATFLAFQTGQIAAGSTLVAKIYATSAGAPTGAAIATSTNSYDPSKISTSTSGQYLHFNFASVALSASTVYAVSLEGTFTVNATNFVKMLVSSSNPYAGGSQYTNNGTTWANTSGSDFVFETNGNWITDIGNGSFGNQSTTQNQNFVQGVIDNQETTIRRQPGTSTVQFLTRTVPNIGPSANATIRPTGGLIFGNTLAIGGSPSTTQSVNGSISQIAYAKYDPNLWLNISNGDASGIKYGVTTGAVPVGLAGEEKSGTNFISSPTVTGTVYFPPVPNFQSGYAYYTKGNSGYTSYPGIASGANFVYSNQSFVFEAEIQWQGSGQQMIIANGDTTTGGPSAFLFGINGSNFLFAEFVANASGEGISTASDKVEPSTYHKVRVTFDGSVFRLYRAESFPYTTFTEVGSYSAQTTNSAKRGYGNATNLAMDLGININANTSTNYWVGYIGYVKAARNTMTFAYDGYSSQAPLVGLTNLGSMAIMRQRLGQSTTTLSTPTSYNTLQSISLQTYPTAQVSSYDLYSIYNSPIQTANQGTSMSVQVTQLKASDKDVSGIAGINFRFLK